MSELEDNVPYTLRRRISQEHAQASMAVEAEWQQQSSTRAEPLPDDDATAEPATAPTGAKGAPAVSKTGFMKAFKNVVTLGRAAK